MDGDSSTPSFDGSHFFSETRIDPVTGQEGTYEMFAEKEWRWKYAWSPKFVYTGLVGGRYALDAIEFLRYSESQSEINYAEEETRVPPSLPYGCKIGFTIREFYDKFGGFEEWRQAPPFNYEILKTPDPQPLPQKCTERVNMVHALADCTLFKECCIL